MRVATGVLTLLALAPALAGGRGQVIVIEGEIAREDHQTYIAREFEVPEGIEGLSIELVHDGAADRTVIDLGLRDPAGFRGWTGSNKNRIEISAFDSTPGYRNGPILSGTWALLLGVPNAREGVRTRYTATVTLYERYDLAGALAGDAARDTAARWYRGDLHAHIGHSDGYCLSSRGVSVPCPVHLTVEAAVQAGLDFLAVTDHNTLSHHQSLRELQPYYDGILLVPGREITTFFGHANVFGAPGFIDHRLGPATGRGAARLLEEVQAQGALISINHPALPSGEECMGCGWRLTDVDFRAVDAIEVINGAAWNYLAGSPEAEGGIAFWQSILDRGVRITAVGGSDNHDPKLTRARGQAAVGMPATVVYARGLAQEDLFAGLRSGRVFVDLSGDAGRAVALSASSGREAAVMGGNLPSAEGTVVRLEIQVTGAEPGDMLELVTTGGRSLPLDDPRLESADETRVHELVSDGGYDWLRVNVRNAEGRLLLLSNPIYLNAAGETAD